MELAYARVLNRSRPNFGYILFLSLLVFLNIYKSIFYYFGLNWLPLGFSVLIAMSLLIGRILSNNALLGIAPLLKLFSIWALIRLFHQVVFGEAMISIVGFTSLYLNFFLWTFLFHQKKPRELFFAFLKVIFYLGLIMAVFSIYQYFLNYELFVKPHSLYGNAEVYEAQSHITRRSTSFIGSPQNLGFYLILIFPLTNVFLRGKFLRLGSKAAILLGGLLSGSATFGGGLVILAVLHELGRKRRRALVLIAMVLVFLFLLAGNPFQRDEAYLNVLNMGIASHLSYYEKYFQDLSAAQFFFGHGLGYADRLTEKYFVDRPDSGWLSSSESFLLRVYYELGAVGTILYATIIYFAIRILRANQSDFLSNTLFGISILIVVNGVFTPVQSGITGSFLAWPFLIYPFIQVGRRTQRTSAGLTQVRQSLMSRWLTLRV